MYCSNCGTQAPDDANFCLKCGKQLRQVQSGDTVGKGWETCDIQEESNPSELRAFLDAGIRGIPIVGSFLLPSGNPRKYVAKALGVKGIYVVAETRWSKGNQKDSERLVSELVTQLTQLGWEPVGKGENWYNYKFRRHAR